MKLEAEQVLCRFHLTTRLRHRQEPLYQWIVETAHRENLQGATVLKGLTGLRPDGSVLAENALAAVQDLPIVVEIVDGPRHIERLLAAVEPALVDSMVTLERAHVVLYRAASDRGTATVARADVIASQGNSQAWEVKTMKPPQEGVLLRIFVGEGDRGPQGNVPVYEALVQRAREAHLAAVTVLKGPLGFGRHARVHTTKVLDLSTDLPVIVEIVDTEARIDAFLPVVDQCVTEGLVTLEAVRILRYGASIAAPTSS